MKGIILIECDVLIIGGGVIGFSIGNAILESDPSKKVVVVDKEFNLGVHSSGRNSGVLHAGFYYTPESLKAQFCREGNLELRKLCKMNNIKLLETGKVVVCKNNQDIAKLESLYSRGVANGCDIELLEEKELSVIEPLATTSNLFLWSPKTAVSSPIDILNAMKKNFKNRGGEIHLGVEIKLMEENGEIYEKSLRYQAKHYVNAAGGHADRLARDVNVGKRYAMIPFLGVYRLAKFDSFPLKRLVYPVPHQVNPFLGVHFTTTLDNNIKIGPTAIPIFSRESYQLINNINLQDFYSISKSLFSIAKGKSHSLWELTMNSYPQLLQKYIVREASTLVKNLPSKMEWKNYPSGIRAQLVDLYTGNLVQDFVVERYQNSTHVLNAVSPGWTSSIPFGRYIANEILS